MRGLDYDGDILNWMQRAFEQNTRWWQPLFGVEPSGWSAATRKRLAQVLSEADSYVQALNHRFTDPSGHSQPRRPRRGSDHGKPEKPATETVGESARELEAIKPPADFVHEDAGASASGQDSVSVGVRR